jgi:Holliday junction resolvase RusA-like endonuclease
VLEIFLFRREMTNKITFTVFDKPQPQGSVKGFVIPGKGGAKPRAILTSDNAKMKPYRQQISWAALDACFKAGVSGIFADKHVAVGVEFKFYFAKPKSISKKRTHIVVRPDIDKTCRSTIDAMTGIVFADDAQIVELKASKYYGTPERAEVVVSLIEDDAASMF